MFERMNCCGQLEGRFGEYLGYGYLEGATLVAKMVIDEGGSNKKTRNISLKKTFSSSVSHAAPINHTGLCVSLISRVHIRNSQPTR